MVLKLLFLGCGVFGVCFEVIVLIEVMLVKGVLLVILLQGLVGVLGDLVLLVYMVVVMLGEGCVVYQGYEMVLVEVLVVVGLLLVVLVVKEGLVLINGMQVLIVFVLVGLWDVYVSVWVVLVILLLLIDVIMGLIVLFLDQIYILCGYCGQIVVVCIMCVLMDGFEICESYWDGDMCVQDFYCICCQLQVIGVCIDLLG